jgi:hypothetical protein
MKNRNSHWLVRTIFCTMFILTVFSFVPNIAHAKAAITCYKDGCDETDPVVTGCGTSPSTVTTITTVSLPNQGLLEIRLSHASPYGCNTVWERLTSYRNNSIPVQSSLFSERAQLMDYISIDPYGSYTQAWGNQFGRDGSFQATISMGSLSKTITFS